MTEGNWPAPATERPGPLSGVRILDLTVSGPGPYCTLILGSYGADVIHVSRAGKLDPTTDSTHHSCDKRSIRIDLKAPAGVKIVRQLAASADILLEGFRPGVMERLGLGPDILMEGNPRLVYVRMTGFGQTGAYAGEPGHDINYIGIGGALSAVGRDQPTPPMQLLGDFAAGSFVAAINIFAALRDRDVRGVGGVIDTNIADGAAMLVHSLLHASPRAGGVGIKELLDGTAPFYRTYRCADDKWFSVGAIEPKFYANLLRGLDLADDPVAKRQYDEAVWPEIAEIFEKRFAERTRAEWSERLVHIEACAFPVLVPAELADDPHLAERETATRRNGQGHVARAGRYVGEPATQFGPTCRTGEHTDSILAGIGYDDAGIAQLHAQGAVQGMPRAE